MWASYVIAPSLLTSHGVGNGGGDTFYTLPPSPTPLADYRLRWEINLLEGLFPSRSFRVVTPTNSGPDNERKSSGGRHFSASFLFCVFEAKVSWLMSPALVASPWK